MRLSGGRLQHPGTPHITPVRGLSAAVPGSFLLVLAVCLAILLAALPHLGPVLIEAQPALQLLSATLFLWRRVPLPLLLT